MRVIDAMTRDLCVCGPEETLAECAEAMLRNDIGVLPVAENNVLVGMVTDRDIAVRGVAAGRGPDTPVRDVSSKEVLYCFEDQDLADVAHAMGRARVRRIPVLTRDNRVAGILSLSDVARRLPDAAGHAVSEVSKRGGPHAHPDPRKPKEST